MNCYKIFTASIHGNKKKENKNFPPDLIYDICSHSADTDQGQKNFPSCLLVQGQHSENLLVRNIYAMF